MTIILLSITLLFPFLFAGSGPAQGIVGRDGVMFVGSKDADEGWLGVSIQDMNPRLAESMKVKTEEGALVNDVIDKSPAESAGIQKEDIIVEFNGEKIDDANDLVREVRKVEPRKNAAVTVMRSDVKSTLQVTVGEMPRKHRIHAFAPHPPRLLRMNRILSHDVLGMSMQDLTEQLAEYFGAPDNQGVLITEVEKGSAAEKAGFKAGDVITKAGKESVNDIEDIWDEVEEYEEGEKVDFEVLRKGSTITLSVEVDDIGNHRFFDFRHSPRGELKFNFDGPCIDAWGSEFDREIELEIEREVERAKPELDRLKIELERIGKEVKENMKRFKEEIKNTINSLSARV